MDDWRESPSHRNTLGYASQVAQEFCNDNARAGHVWRKNSGHCCRLGHLDFEKPTMNSLLIEGVTDQKFASSPSKMLKTIFQTQQKQIIEYI